MSTPLHSLIQTGTKLWLDSVDPELVTSYRTLGATGATSNPAIIGDLLSGNRFDNDLAALFTDESDDENIAWKMTDQLVSHAEKQFADVWKSTAGDDGYVSFEVDPMIDAAESLLSHSQRVQRYIHEAQRWYAGHTNRMIKVPATPAGLDALEEISAQGIPLNVTLVFTSRQYQRARNAIWRGYARSPNPDLFKSVYSIFVSRVDVYAAEHVPQLMPAARGLLGVVNAKRMWRENQQFWSDKPTRLSQEIVFASTGTKDPQEPAWKYVEALAGSDIQTNPPATNQAIQESTLTFRKQIDQMPSSEVLADIDAQVDFEQLEETLMREGLAKFAIPHQQLLRNIARKRATLVV
jgi:transaldolase